MEMKSYVFWFSPTRHLNFFIAWGFSDFPEYFQYFLSSALGSICQFMPFTSCTFVKRKNSLLSFISLTALINAILLLSPVWSVAASLIPCLLYTSTFYCWLFCFFFSHQCMLPQSLFFPSFLCKICYSVLVLQNCQQLLEWLFLFCICVLISLSKMLSDSKEHANKIH